jgi:hypothetical protein
MTEQVICHTRCFYKDRLWAPGETLTVEEGEECPTHFKPVKAKPGDARAEEGGANLRDMTKKEIAAFAKRLYRANIDTNKKRDEMLAELAEVQQALDPEGELLQPEAHLVLSTYTQRYAQ